MRKFTHSLCATFDDTDWQFVDVLCNELHVTKTELFRYLLDRIRRDRASATAAMRKAGMSRADIKAELQVDTAAVLLRKLPY